MYGHLLPVISPKIFGAQILKRLIYMSMEKKFHSFYAVELMIHFLAEESFLDMQSDILLSLIPGVSIV